MRVHYRPAIATDTAGIAAAHAAAHRETWRGLVEDRDLRPGSSGDYLARWTQRLSDASVSVFVAEADGQIIGAGACGAVDGEGVILDILVLKSMQCRGVGTRLMGLMACDLKARGHGSVSLWAPERNVVAIVFFRAIGGDIVDAAPTGGCKGLPALRLRWESLDDLAFWNGSVSPSHRAQTRRARGEQSPSAAERTACPDAFPPTSAALRRD